MLADRPRGSTQSGGDVRLGVSPNGPDQDLGLACRKGCASEARRHLAGERYSVKPDEILLEDTEDVLVPA
jgi:hypothetical protein